MFRSACVGAIGFNMLLFPTLPTIGVNCLRCELILATLVVDDDGDRIDNDLLGVRNLSSTINS